MILASTFLEFAAILGLAAVLGIIGLLLRQPLIVVFIVVGILAGPAAFNIVKSHENIHLLAEIGISILLFIVGLKLDLGIIRHVGKVALLTEAPRTAALGLDTRNAYRAGLAYNDTLEAAKTQEALGWQGAMAAAALRIGPGDPPAAATATRVSRPGVPKSATSRRRSAQMARTPCDAALSIPA